MIVAWCCKPPDNWTYFWNFMGAIARLSYPGFRICSQDVSASLRNKSCKRLGSCPKRSIKRCLSLLIFSRWTHIIRKPDNGTSRPECWHDYGQLTTIRTPRRLYKIEQMNYVNSPQQIQLFTQMPELSLYDFKNWADELWKLAKVNTAFHSVFAQMSELSFND